MTDTGLSPQDDLWQMVNGYEISRAIHVVATLGVADLMVDGPKEVRQLASETRTDPPTLYRVLRAVASVGVFEEDSQGRFGLTPRAQYLRSDMPGSVRAWAMMVGGPSFWASWGDLLDSVKTGETAFPKLHGMTNWEYRVRHPDEQSIFDAAMTVRSAAAMTAIVNEYDFAQFDVLVDVGGGHGVLLAAILAANPSVRGILFDQSQVVAEANSTLRSNNVADRCAVIGGDFFESVPSGADAYLLKSVLHDWDDEQATRTLKCCRAAMTQRGKLLVVEAVIHPPNEPDPMKFTDLRMLVMNGGRERTSTEFGQLYVAAGFNLGNIVQTRSPFSIVEGTPA